VVFAGMGGEISDDPDTPRDERERLRYPRWEAEYRLKVLGLLDYNELVMLFASAPAHKGRDVPGSEAVAELVGTYRPRLSDPGMRLMRGALGRANRRANRRRQHPEPRPDPAVVQLNGRSGRDRCR
jgi:Metallophosphoesterase, calcineurin superfamily